MSPPEFSSKIREDSCFMYAEIYHSDDNKKAGKEHYFQEMEVNH